jgi:phage-related protein
MWMKAVQGLTIANIALNIAMNANPVGLIILGITALIAVVILIINHWDDLGKAFKAFADKFVGFFTGIGDIFKKAFAGVSFSGLFDAFKNMINNILNFARGLGGTFLQIGKDIVQGMINGIGSMISSAINAVKNVASAITNGIKSALGINSPSRVFMAVGSGLTEGLVKGIDKTAYLAVNSVKDLGKSLQVPMELSPLGGIGSISTASAQPITVNITAGLGTDSYELGRVVSAWSLYPWYRQNQPCSNCI